MRQTINRAADFIRKNPSIIYSLVLIVAVTVILFGNTYYALSKFQSITDGLLQSKALLAEDTIKLFASDSFDDSVALGKKFAELVQEDKEVRSVSFLKPTEGKESSFSVVAADNEKSLNQESSDMLFSLLWNSERPFAFIGHDEDGRFWNVGSAVKNSQGEKEGIILFQLSLKSHDDFIQSAIMRVYVLTLLSLLIVLLLVLNHIRTFKYAIRASQLEEIDKMKDDFISMASHELKSPLTAMGGYVELLKEDFPESGKGEKNEGKHYLEQIEASTKRLKDLVEDLLEVSRLQQNRIPIVLAEISLVDICAKVIDEMKVVADGKGLAIINELHNIPAAVADPDRARQIIMNLISNAIKYTPKGTVTLMGKEDDEAVYLTVADTGLGMSADNIKNLFSRFYRVRNEKTAEISGTGLGLWISRELAQKMGGDLTVESIEGVGSHFTLKLKKVSNKR